MLKTLTLGLQLATALASLAFSIGIVITGMLNRSLAKKKQLKPELQAPPQSIPASSAPVAKSSPPPQPAPSPAAHHKTPAMILNARDHKIYMTTDSTLMVPHPKGDKLLKELDKVLYAALHRNGAPFRMPVELDTSAQSRQPVFEIQHVVEDDEFLPTAPIPLPVPDGHLWYSACGKRHQRLGSAS